MTVRNGVLQHCSASAIELFLTCERKWAAGYTHGIWAPPTRELATGNEMHDELEAAANGTPPTRFASCKLALPYVRSYWHDGHYQAERPLETPKLYLADVWVKGFIDLLNWSDPQHIRILDYKTKLRFKARTGLTEEELAQNVQAHIYSLWAAERFPEAEAFSFSHLYLLMPQEDADPGGVRPPVTVSFTRDEVLAFRKPLEAVVARMKVAATRLELMDQPPTESACMKYGPKYRCHLYDRCWGAGKGMADLFASSPTPPPSEGVPETMSLKDLIEKQKRAQSAPPAAEAPTPTMLIDTPVLATGVNPPDAAKPAPVVTPYRPPAPPPAAAPPAAAPLEGPGGLVLFINCAPRKGVATYQYLDEEVARRAAPIAAKHGVTDIREVKYSEGTTALLADFRRNPPTGAWIAHEGGLQTAVLEVLQPLASVIIRPDR